MQIDFHHGTTYVLARLAGFEQPEAEIIAYCAQYVDDATNKATIKFSNGALFERIASAHKMLDYKNFKELDNHKCWIPFHFLPGNQGKAAGENPGAGFYNKIVCTPNSHVAQDMVRACIEGKDKPWALHRLGISMHVYADTFAHQGFAGVTHAINRVENIEALDDDEDAGFFGRLKDSFGDKWDDVKSGLVGDVFPLGHGAALSYPDRPFLNWTYDRPLIGVNGKVVKGRDGKEKLTAVVRSNPDDFMSACYHLHNAMQRFKLGNADAHVQELSARDSDMLQELFTTLTDTDGEQRHKHWLDAIAAGKFSFGAETVNYIGEGPGSWKYQILGETLEGPDDEITPEYPFKREFLTSNWKYFHDAALAHRFDVIHNILPRYGICVA